MATGTETSTPYVPLYIDPVLALAVDDAQALRALLVLLKCADSHGWCFPGDQYIADLAHMSRDNAGFALDRLQMRGLIHIEYTARPHRKAPDRDIQLSPAVLAVAPDHREKALADWTHNANQSTNLAPSVDLHIDQLREEKQHGVEDTQVKQDVDQSSLKTPTTNRTNNRINSIPNSSDLTPQPTTTTDQHPEGLVSAGSGNGQPDADTGEGEGQEKKRTTKTPPSAAGTARNAQPQRRMPREEPSPPTPSPATPVKRAHAPIKSALSDPHDEAVAAQMKKVTGSAMGIAVARGLVVAYGAGECQTAVIALSKKRRIQNPGGHLRWMIETQQVDPDKDGRDEDTQEHDDIGKKYVSGKYADAINH